MTGVWVLIELVGLFFLSQLLTRRLFAFLFLITSSRTFAITVILLLQFPGTVVHELSHLFTAEILRVPTGKLTLVPESIREQDIKPGSVRIALTDPFRRYMIGTAPLFVGLIILCAIAYVIELVRSDIYAPSLIAYIADWRILGLGYLLYAVSNSMFASPEDIRGIFPFLISCVSIVLLFYAIGVRFELSGYAYTIVEQIMYTLMKSLLVVLTLNISLLAVIFGLHHFILSLSSRLKGQHR